VSKLTEGAFAELARVQQVNATMVECCVTLPLVELHPREERRVVVKGDMSWTALRLGLSIAMDLERDVTFTVVENGIRLILEDAPCSVFHVPQDIPVTLLSPGSELEFRFRRHGQCAEPVLRVRGLLWCRKEWQGYVWAEELGSRDGTPPASCPPSPQPKTPLDWESIVK